MDLSSSTTLTAAPPAPGAGVARLAERFSALPPMRKALLAGGLLLFLALVGLSAVWSSRPDYRVLFSNLNDKDGGAIVAQLSKMNVPYRFSEGGGAVLVPADQVHDVRLKLAQTGLPKGSTVGFELMDNARFGTTQFQERLNFQRGLEGELVRSITALSAVESARVHLALPNQNGFFRDQQKPSASVLLTLYGGQTLERAQIAGIVHLVSASVPELSPKSVSVLDQSGAMLSDSGDGAGGGLDSNQVQHVARVEALYTKRILDILEPIVGRDNLRAQVTAELDFSQSESTTEEFKPNQGGVPAAVRSAQVSENGAGGAGGLLASGVPGAATNQPQAAASAPINGAAQTLQTAQAGQGGALGAGGRRDAVTNYEIDKTVRVVRAATGGVRRLTVAVVVNHRSTTDKKGQTQSQPLAPEEIDKLVALVQETVGFSKERGDSVKVINAPFRAPTQDKLEPLPLWKQPETLEMVRTLAVPLVLGLLGLALVFGVIRPVLRDIRVDKELETAKLTGQLNTVVDDVTDLPALSGGDALVALPAPVVELSESDKRLEAVRQMVRTNPASVARILRGWANGKEAD
ncbi:flagellar basal-body MS-ring/collar protein FliF [Sphaerotilus sp.]|uniref:flagellar basal-body MS-ring/collar protein FliF n=1 Tax=Sphaerotilus sp. TaxID=2093942 RepID=UPI002ACF084F|nr:flagellar basal-body MS-ring/collar protein FliF [Sphaerotilus sp.]MDZ7857640.1 flagellar basal-body MS-ring/collar protein FliF [Sphaerotilus sp.]